MTTPVLGSVDRVSGTMTVAHLGDDRFAADVRGHRIVVDQPVDAHGTDTGPTPVELLMASLTTCVAFYARRYLRRHGLPEEGLTVTADWTTAKTPSRVDSIALRLHLPEGVPADQRDAVLTFASHCTVHNTLMTAPGISLTLEEAP